MWYRFRSLSITDCLLPSTQQSYKVHCNSILFATEKISTEGQSNLLMVIQ